MGITKLLLNFSGKNYLNFWVMLKFPYIFLKYDKTSVHILKINSSGKKNSKLLGHAEVQSFLFWETHLCASSFSSSSSSSSPPRLALPPLLPRLLQEEEGGEVVGYLDLLQEQN